MSPFEEEGPFQVKPLASATPWHSPHLLLPGSFILFAWLAGALSGSSHTHARGATQALEKRREDAQGRGAIQTTEEPGPGRGSPGLSRSPKRSRARVSPWGTLSLAIHTFSGGTTGPDPGAYINVPEVRYGWIPRAIHTSS